MLYYEMWGQRGGMVTQRTANPCIPVRFWALPPKSLLFASEFLLKNFDIMTSEIFFYNILLTSMLIITNYLWLCESSFECISWILMNTLNIIVYCSHKPCDASWHYLLSYLVDFKSLYYSSIRNVISKKNLVLLLKKSKLWF